MYIREQIPGSIDEAIRWVEAFDTVRYADRPNHLNRGQSIYTRNVNQNGGNLGRNNANQAYGNNF